MAPVGAFRHLSLALGAAVAVLGSLILIAWKIYFRDVNDSSIGWRERWEQQLEAELERSSPNGGKVTETGRSQHPSAIQFTPETQDKCSVVVVSKSGPFAHFLGVWS